MQRKQNPPLYTVAQMRNYDAATIAAGTDGITLMGRAAKGAFDLLQYIHSFPQQPWPENVYFIPRWEKETPVFPVSKNPRYVIAAGGGNNGGDGWALAWLLKKAGEKVRVVYLSQKSTETSDYYIQKAKEVCVPTAPFTKEETFSDADLIVDCLLGTGFSGALRDDMVSCIRAMNQSGKPVLSMDINSGMDGDTGTFAAQNKEECLHSALTFTIGLTKKGLVSPQSLPHIGSLFLCDIGIMVPKELCI